LTANSGGNAILAGDGDDILIGSADADLFLGEARSDAFVFSMSANTGEDVIADFEIGTDVLKFTDVVDVDSPAGLDFDDAVTSVVDNGTDITANLYNGGGSITLSGLGDGTVATVSALETLLTSSSIDVS